MNLGIMKFIYDFLSFLILSLQFAVVILPCYFVVTFLPVNIVLKLVLMPFSFALGLLMSMAFVRIVLQLVGEIKSGTYDFPKSKPALQWTMVMMIKKIYAIPTIRGLVYSYYTLKKVFFWSLRSPSSGDFTCSPDITLLDPSFTTFSSGCVIGALTRISSHMIYDGKILIAPVSFGKNCEVGGFGSIMPGCEFGENVKIGRDVRIESHVIIGDGSKVGMNVNIARDVSIGKNVVIGSNVTIGRKSQVADNAVVKSNTIIASEARVN